MMMIVAHEPRGPEAEHGACERRSQARYPLAIEISYAVLGDTRRGETRTGHTIDLNSSSLRFRAAEPLGVGATVEIAINWPSLAKGCIPMQLVATAIVVRTCGKETVVRIERHAFHTQEADSSSQRNTVLN